MKKNSLTTAVVAGIAGVAGFAGLANAVHLNSDGLGQVLLYPYYTVNAGQQTLLSVVNTADVARVVKVRFLEGYNSREVLDFNLWLSPFDVWTATVFNLRDAGKNSDGGAIFTRDNSCTTPRFSSDGNSLDDGTPYVTFKNFAYAGVNVDGGPVDVTRTREGHFEILSMADVRGGLATAITHNANGVPANCGAVAVQVPSTHPDLVVGTPAGGLFGAAGVINVDAGTFYTYNADALDQFTNVKIFTTSGSLEPNLNSVNDVILGGAATAHVFTGSGVTTSLYGSIGTTSPVDAVSAIFSADAVYNEYVTDAAVSANSDWVVTFPTKAFYVDPSRLVAGSPARAPFEELFRRPAGGVATDARSCAAIDIDIYNREELTTGAPAEGEPPFSPLPPGEIIVGRALCKEVNVISFLDVDVFPSASGVLGSTLLSNVKPVVGAQGWMKLNLDPAGDHDMDPADNNNNVWSGLPVTGFWATSLVNNHAAVIDGVSTLSNYSAVFRHRTSRNCSIDGAGVLACS